MTSPSARDSLEIDSAEVDDSPRFHPGLSQALAAMAVAAVATFTISASSWNDPIAPRLAIVGFALFSLAVAVGSSRMVGAASFPVLGSALIASTLETSSTWVESIVIGCLWYLAVELGWDSIERRDGAVRSVAYNLRRVQELSSVLVICLGAVWIAFAATALGPTRTLFGRGLLLAGLVSALAFLIGHITSTAPNTEPDA